MKLSYTNSNAATDNRRAKSRVSRSERGMNSGDTGHYFPVPDIWHLFKQLFSGLGRIFVVLKYFLHGLMPNLKGEIKLPWLKIGIVAVTIFIVSKKDINFSINMRAPSFTEMAETSPVKKDEMGIVQAVNYYSTSEKKASSPMPAPTTAEVKAYVKRFSKVAQSEMDKFGIPASINLAQAILESAAGKSKMAREINNHFGEPMADKSYGNAWENWRAHSLLLKSEYQSLFNNEQGSYKTWAKGLKKLKYSKDKSYDKKLIQIVEKYQLYLLDEQL